MSCLISRNFFSTKSYYIYRIFINYHIVLYYFASIFFSQSLSLPFFILEIIFFNCVPRTINFLTNNPSIDCWQFSSLLCSINSVLSSTPLSDYFYYYYLSIYLFHFNFLMREILRSSVLHYLISFLLIFISFHLILFIIINYHFFTFYVIHFHTFTVIHIYFHFFQLCLLIIIYRYSYLLPIFAVWIVAIHYSFH